ncbi:RNA-binding domain-containing protein [Bosea sp. CCNWLW174]|uniref:RNA-binding domain-containing protein n=1 Tax=unclassified Bosea (in: a-proteobacteria) TaxID=2653178 RepID=UPI003014EF61
MRDELRVLHAAIESRQLPAGFSDLFSDLWNCDERRFHVQETYILDYKETIPEKWTDSYGASILRLALAFHNSYGGIAVFGVKDRSLTVSGVSEEFDIESFNRAITDFTGSDVECVAKSFSVDVDSERKKIIALLVPRRGFVEPVKLNRDLAGYKSGRIWVRDRHEVVEPSARHLPIIYSDRSSLPADVGMNFPIHRSFPPSPATVKEFVNRPDLLKALWSWFVLGDQPRIYLHGPGGSGKSTLAFEFARLLVEHGASVRSKNGDRLDYAIYISGKETELNIQTGKQQAFQLRQFSNASEQFSQILFHSGMVSLGKNFQEMDYDSLTSELFDNYSGLIVIDDIDALSRQKIDTGEESLFMKTVLAKKRTRILYTLRFPPAHALNSALPVPGLDVETEFFDFLDICCKQFGSAPPPAEKIPLLQEATSRLPLLIETIIWLKQYCGNYTEAIANFKAKGGDESRRYLYQREYDRLDSSGKSRQLLAGLFLLEQPVSFSTLSGLFQFSKEQLRDALTECSGVFLSTLEGEGGETLYQLTPPCIPFVSIVSEQLSYFNGLRTRVDHFKSQGTKTTPEEAAVISSMSVLIRQRKFIQIAQIGEGRSQSDPVLLNPRVQSLLGQAYSELGPDYREKARECFRHAEGLAYRDGYMMRRWYNMELASGYGVAEAERICNVMINDERFEPRIKSEFWSKLGACYLNRATAISLVNKDKMLEHLRTSICAYLEGLRLGRKGKDFDASDNLNWLERPLAKLIGSMGPNVEQVFLIFEQMSERRNDIDRDGAELIFMYLTRLQQRPDSKMKSYIVGLCSRTSSKIKKSIRKIDEMPGFTFVLQALAAFQIEIGDA